PAEKSQNIKAVLLKFSPVVIDVSAIRITKKLGNNLKCTKPGSVSDTIADLVKKFLTILALTDKLHPSFNRLYHN
ncbi:MAG: hypothetical protein PHY21_05405, partial [Candidatus Cloacimonetes bacterium]|nr:hypothetical protein [Candidatus Cloacimonadota bacterium]MDD4035162.1 hypothetical protein [Candidatus Cloacimonadota bacterium]